jgi:hypothetical protein
MDPCHQLATQLGTHMWPLPRQLKTARHKATINTEQPAPSRHVMQRGSPTHAQRTPTWPMAHCTAPKTCPANPQADTHTPHRRLSANNPQCQLLDHLLGHLTTPNRHCPPRALGHVGPIIHKISPRHEQFDEVRARTELGLRVDFFCFFVLIASVLGESELSDRSLIGVLGVRSESDRIPGGV